MRGIDQNKNNFDFLRFIAAFLVIFSHSYTLSYGTNDGDPLKVLTGTTCGSLGVYIFFILSGFLITSSYNNTGDVKKFLAKRALRIFPALFFGVFITVLVIGPVMTDLAPAAYFTHTMTLRYPVTVSIVKIYNSLPSVFAGNPFPYAVNGSLWTLKFEVACYLTVCLIGYAGIIGRWSAVVIMSASAAISLFIGCSGMEKTGLVYNVYYYFFFMVFFSSGMLFYVLGKRISLNPAGIAVCLAVMIISAGTVLFPYVVAVAGTYIIMFLSFACLPWLNNFARYGDFSYGMYIFAFPVQQSTSHLFPGSREWWCNMAISLPVILALSCFSWHMIEKRALALKRFL